MNALKNKSFLSSPFLGSDVQHCGILIIQTCNFVDIVVHFSCSQSYKVIVVLVYIMSRVTFIYPRHFRQNFIPVLSNMLHKVEGILGKHVEGLVNV